MGGGDISDIFEAMFGGGGGGFGNVRFGGMGGMDDFEGMEEMGEGVRVKVGGKKRRSDAPEEGKIEHTLRNFPNNDRILCCRNQFTLNFLSRGRAGEEVTMEREISFMTSIFGGQEKVRVRRLEECDTCTGTGIKPGAKVKTCGTCGGQGLVNNAQRTPFGLINSVQTCPGCKGSGQEVSEFCAPCKGKGTIMGSKELTVKIPKGVENGAVMRVKEGGSAGKRGGARGDLFLQLNVKPDPRFQREGNDIHATEEISYTDAILGTTIRADVVDGPLSLKVPPGTQPGQRLRVKGKGAHKLNSETRGDAYVTIKVKIPTKLSAREKELVEQLAGSAEKS